jgi:hypothetical protein
MSRRTHSFHLIKDVRAKSGPRGRRYQNTRNVHLRISENVPPRHGRPSRQLYFRDTLPSFPDRNTSPEWPRPFVRLEIRHLLIRRAMLYTSR